MLATENNFTEGEIVICVLNNRSLLTVGKEYKVEWSSGIWVEIKNDEGDETTYHFSRFLDKSEWRNFAINQILE